MPEQRREFYVPCPMGLEAVLEQEIQALGGVVGTVRRGGIACYGDRRFGYAANLWLRTAIRVQEVVVRGSVRAQDDLYDLVRQVDWREHLDTSRTLAVDASVRDGVFTHSHYVGLRVKDAIVDQFRERSGRRPSVDTKKPDLPLQLHLQGPTATLYRSLSGDSLHKRGWRPVQVKSPLNEALAAGLLQLTGWDRRSPLVDPMCGSGTFLIEAAHWAADRAPGLQRRFAFERWPDFDCDLWRDLRDDAADRVDEEPDIELVGNDRHQGALELARMAARQAGMGDVIEFRCGDAASFEPPAPKVVVVNPPYGQRIGEGKDLEASWRALGSFFHKKCQGAAAWVLSGDSNLTRHLGLRASRKYPVRNGGIDCRWLRYEVGKVEAHD